jgi:TPR repeat protein
MNITRVEAIKQLTKRMEENDADSMAVLANCYYNGIRGLQQDHAKALELYVRAAKLGCSDAHCNLGYHYREGGDLKKAKFHFEAAAMAGDEASRYNLGCLEAQSGNIVRALKHWMIAVSSGDYEALHALLMVRKVALKKGYASKDEIDSTLEAYNNTCAEMQSEARDAYIRSFIKRIGEGLRIGEAL